MLAEFLTTTALVLGPSGGPAPAPPDLGEKIGVLSSSVTGRVPMLEGTTLPILSRGSGHLRSTHLPGAGGTTSWWAHRVTPTLGRPHGPFYDIAEFERGDLITLRMEWGTYRYRVRREMIVDNTDWNAFKPRLVGREKLMLAACHPKYSAAQRYVVVARRVP